MNFRGIISFIFRWHLWLPIITNWQRILNKASTGLSRAEQKLELTKNGWEKTIWPWRFAFRLQQILCRRLSDSDSYTPWGCFCWSKIPLHFYHCVAVSASIACLQVSKRWRRSSKRHRQVQWRRPCPNSWRHRSWRLTLRRSPSHSIDQKKSLSEKNQFTQTFQNLTCGLWDKIEQDSESSYLQMTIHNKFVFVNAEADSTQI